MDIFNFENALKMGKPIEDIFLYSSLIFIKWKYIIILIIPKNGKSIFLNS